MKYLDYWVPPSKRKGADHNDSSMLQGLLQDEWETPEGKNLPLYYTSESFRNNYKS